MANIVNTTNHLENEIISKKGVHIIEVIVLVLILVSMLIFGKIFPLLAGKGMAVIAGIVVVYTLISTRFMDKDIVNNNVIKSGLDGERVAIEVLSLLDDRYYVISDIELQYHGQKAQLDHVIIGPNGIFVVETKNIKGYIEGSDEDSDLFVTKTGKYGEQYVKSMPNPIRQVNRQVYVLSRVLESTGIRTWIQGMVFFSNCYTRIDIQVDKTPVFSYNKLDEIINYIASYKEIILSQENTLEIVDIISEYIIKDREM